MSPETRELVDKFLKGDQKAFAELVRRYKKKIYSIAYRMLGNHLDADEVTQETFVRVYEKRENLKSANYFSSFLLRIATNYCIDLIRRRQKGYVPVDDLAAMPDVQIELAQKIVSPDQDLENAEIFSEIMDAVDRLPPRQKMAVVLHDIEGFSKAEIANALDCPQATVRSNLHIARVKLKKWLSKKFR
jgi:RNA polymerase sigma-70 factor (ECF subfamily)